MLRAMYGAGMMPGRSTSSPNVSGVHLNAIECGGSRLTTANIFLATQKHRSCPHLTSSVTFGSARQIVPNSCLDGHLKQLPDDASRRSLSTARVVCRAIALRRDVGVERDDVAGPRRPMQVEVRDEAVLIAAVADQLDAAVPLDEARQPGLHVVAAAALAVARADLRREHLVERRRASGSALVAVDQERQPFRHVAERRVQAAVRDGDAAVEVEPLLVAALRRSRA